jgi:hypothetical protein
MTATYGDFDIRLAKLIADYPSSKQPNWSHMENAQLLVRALLPIVSGILDRLPKDHKEHQPGGDTPVKGLVEALKKFIPPDGDFRKAYAGYKFPEVYHRP